MDSEEAMSNSTFIALVVSLLVGICAILSYALVPLMLGHEYQGVVPMYYDDGNLYRSRIQEIHDGHGSVVSSFLHEYKDASLSVVPVGEWFYALPAFIFGISAVQWAYFFLLPLALFLLVYFFVRKLIGEEKPDVEWTAIAAGLSVLFGFEFVDYHYLLSLFQAGPPSAIVWTRPINPILGALQLFGFLILLLNVLEGRRKLILPTGILLASMIGYYFAWGMGLAITGMLLLLLTFKKEFARARDVLYIGSVSVLAISPYLYSALATFGGAEGSALSQRTGMFFTHEPIINTVLLATTTIATVCFTFSWWRRTWRENERGWIIIGALLGAGWVAFNQQIITGRDIWHHHFVQYTVPFAYCVVLCAGYFSVRPLFFRLWKQGMVFLASLMIAHGVYTSLFLYQIPLEHFRAQQTHMPLLSWLREYGEESCVVLPLQDEIGKFINAYTSCDVYISASVQNGAPLERLLHNYLLLIRLKGLTFEKATQYFLEHESEVRGYMYDDWSNLFGRGTDDWFLKKTQDLTLEYALFMQEPLDTQLRKYRVGFIVGREPIGDAVAKELPGLGTPQKIGDFYLYEFK